MLISEKKKPQITVISEKQSNINNSPIIIVPYHLIWDNQSNNNNGVPHVKVMWDNRFAKRIDICIDDKVITLE